MNEVINTLNRVETIFYRIFNILFGVTFVIILSICVFLNGIDYGRKGLWLNLIESVPGILFVIIGVGLIILLSLLFLNRKKSNDYTGCKRIHIIIILSVSVAFLLFQIIVSNSYYFYTDWDVATILKMSESVSRNEVPEDFYNTYFSMYPNNLTIVTVFSRIIAISSGLGLDPLATLIVFQCFIYWITGLLLYFSTASFFKNGLIPFFSYILYLALVGMSPWVTVPYSDSVALLFPVLILFIYSRRAGGKVSSVIKWLSIGFITYVGYSIKPQVLFVTISLLIILFIHVIFNKKRNKKNLLKGGICTVGVIIAFFTVNNINSHLQIHIDNNKTFSATHFLMMGMNSEAKGVYSEDDVLFSKSFKTKEERDKANTQKTKERIDNMGLQGVSKLMVQKTLTNYYDGTFCWGGEGKFYIKIPPDKNPLSSFFKNVYYNRNYTGKYNYIWFLFEQCLWMGILTLCVFAVNIKKPKKNMVILMFTILLLTAFQSLFEARARYLFIYTPFYIILATNGCVNFYKIIISKTKKGINELKNIEQFEADT